MNWDRELLSAVLITALATPLGAQVMPNGGAPTSPGASLLKVTATKPFFLGPAGPFGPASNSKGRFRLLFRVVSTTADEVPIAIIAYGGLRADYLFEWTAYSSAGARCFALKGDTSGIKVYDHVVDAGLAIRELQDLQDSETRASPTRPTIISVDFDCDTPIHPGDTVSVQSKFFVRKDYRWTEADYTFENLGLDAH
jgi:hypothetical protein